MSGGSLLWRTAAAVSRPGTFTSSALPGLKPSARFMSTGLIGVPLLFRGISALRRLSRTPVSVRWSRFVYASLGQGSSRFAEAAGGMISSSVRAATAAASPVLMAGDPIRRPF